MYFRVRSDFLLILCVSCRLLNQCRHFFWTRLVDCVAGTLNLDHMALCARGVPPFEVRVDRSVLCAKKALPANVTEPRKMSRREVCFCKKLDFNF